MAAQHLLKSGSAGIAVRARTTTARYLGRIAGPAPGMLVRAGVFASSGGRETMGNLSADLIRDLATRAPGTPVLSIYARTDPRDPANRAAVPGWLVEVRNGLREVSRVAEEGEARDR